MADVGTPIANAIAIGSQAPEEAVATTDPAAATTGSALSTEHRASLPTRLRDFAADVASPAWTSLLLNLADSIATTKDLHLWASISLFEMFGDAADLVQAPRPTRLQRIAMTAPGVLVFLPIVVTWVGLALATGAYRRALALDPSLVGRSFLELWQTGMSGQLNSLFTFDRAALMTLTALFILVTSVVLAAVVRRVHGDVVDEHELRLNQTLHGLLAETSLVLAEEKLTAPDRFAMEFNLATQELRSLHAEARKLQNAAARTTTSAGKAADVASAASTALVDAVVRLDSSVMDVARGVRDTREAAAAQASETTRVSEASALAVSAAVAASVADSMSAARSVVAAHNELTQLVGAMDQNLARAVSEGVATGVGPLTAASADLTRSAGQLSAATVTSLADARAVVLEQRSDVEGASQRLEGIVRQVDSDFAATVHRLTSSLQGQVSGYEAAMDAAGQVSGTVTQLQQSLTALALEMRTLTGRLESLNRVDTRPTIGLGAASESGRD